MATIVGVEADGGAVVAGDRVLAEGGTVESKNERHVFDFGDVGAAAVGGSGDVDAFRRRLDSECRSYETEHGGPVDVTRLANLASDFAEEEGVEAIVVARDDRDIPRIRAIAADGGILTDETVAFGSGAQLALGVLDGASPDIDPDAAEELARDAIGSAADRDGGTGSEIDVYRLAGDEDLV